MCKNNDETIDHLFVKYPFSKEVWSEQVVTIGGRKIFVIVFFC
jgi:hypothetical protein